MTLRHLSLDELESVPLRVELDAARAALLSTTALVDVRPAGGSAYDLLPNGRVGVVRLDDVQVEVRPKDRLRIEHLLFLLGYAQQPGWRPESVVAGEHDQLWPAMAEALVRAVAGALGQGLLQGYRLEEEALRTVRGRILFDEMLRRRAGIPVPIDVRYDEFTVDVPENQILLAAVELMLRVPRLGEDQRRRLLHLRSRFEGVGRLRRGAPLPRWRASRLNQRYVPALRLAEILLLNSSTTAGERGVSVSAFVVEMWRVFEDFVTVALTEALADVPGSLNQQLHAFLTGDGDWQKGARTDVEMEVDLVHLDPAGRPQVVLDAKYKLASSTGGRANDDHYQMLAYCTALKVPCAWLVYAGGGDEIRRRIKHAEVEVVMAPLDLSRPPDELLEQVRNLALRAVGEAAPFAPDPLWS